MAALTAEIRPTMATMEIACPVALGSTPMFRNEGQVPKFRRGIYAEMN
jgi:hypothetical protein